MLQLGPVGRGGFIWRDGMRVINGPARKAWAAAFLASAMLVGGSGATLAQAAFGEVDRTPTAAVNFTTSDRSAILAGSEVLVTGDGFDPGQKVTLLYGTRPLDGGALTADAEGKLNARIAVPANAVSGTHPILVVAENPYHALVGELKVSPTVPLSGQDQYRLTEAQAARGLYQSAYSAKNNTLFVTSSMGRPPVRQSELVKMDADTLDVIARITPPPAPAREGAPANNDPGVFAVYGAGVDEAKGTVWVTNTRQNTVAVYNQSDLSLVKQFEPGTVEHARDVRIDAELGKAYVGSTTTPDIKVIDTNSLAVAGTITITSPQRGNAFNVASLSLDQGNHRLYVVSLADAPEVAVIDTRTDQVLKVLPVPGARSAIGVSHDPQTGRIYVAAQGSDNLIVLDGESGAVIADTPVGAGALNVAFDPTNRRAYVASRGAGTVTVTDPDGKILANLGPAPMANHVALGKDGTIYAVDKSANARDAENDTILKIAPVG
jgi:DNA-binding beta-propeller fold protein YncE